MSSTSSTRCSARRRPVGRRIPEGHRHARSATLLALAAVIVYLAGCTGLPDRLPEDPRRELAAVPFFPQSDYQCGPAALATVLSFNGVAVTPDELTPQVYIPARRGSLQVEMLAATRRAGRIPYVIGPSAPALMAELAAGRPVLVLQDLVPPFLSRFGVHRWHYAVVVGYDPERETYILRSGRERRRLEPARRFLAAWDASDRWGVVVDEPGSLPASATASRYLRAVRDSAGALSSAALADAHAAMLARWPGDPLLLFASANQAYADGRLADAESRYRRLLAIDADHAAARNNLANVLLDRGCPSTAAREARTALLTDDVPAAFLDGIRDTLTKAENSGNDAPGCELAPE